MAAKKPKYYTVSLTPHYHEKTAHWTTAAVLNCKRCNNVIDNSGGPGSDTLCLACAEKFLEFMNGANAIKDAMLGVPLVSDMFLVMDNTGKPIGGSYSRVPKLYKKGSAKSWANRSGGTQYKAVAVTVMAKPIIERV